MNGKGIYFATAALLAILSVLLHFLLFVLLFLLYVFLLYRYKAFTKKSLTIILCLYGMFFCIGSQAKVTNVTAFTGHETEFNVILKQWQINGDSLKINVKEESTNEVFLLQYRIKTAQEKQILTTNLTYGMKCHVSGELNSPSTSRNPNAFDYQEYLAAKQIFWILNASQNPLNQCTSTEPSVIAFVEGLRHNGIEYILRHFPEPLASLSVALNFGERAEMSSQLVASYQKIGIVHLLAISGMQVSFFTGLLFLMGIRIGIVRETMLNILILFLPFFALMTGASPSVIRAVVMMLFIFISLRFANKRFQPLDAWSGAFMSILAFAPFLIFDVGFQLSFTACFALIMSAKLLANYRSFPTQLLMTTMIAQIATLPILLFHFYEFASISLFTNFLFVPLFSAILSPVTFFLFIFHPILGLFLSPIISFLNMMLVWTNQMIEWFSALPFTMITLGKPTLLLLSAYILSVILTFIFLEKKPGRITWHCCWLLIPLIFQIAFNLWSPYGEITFIDVGQGDSFLIKLPFNDGTYLLDTGGAVPFSRENWQEKSRQYEVGKDTIVPFLKSKGINTLDKLILSHGDFDHIGGVMSILNEIKVKEMVLPKVFELSDLETEIIAEAERKGVLITFVSEGATWKTDTAQFHVLSPPANIEQSDKNNGSIVLFAELGGLKWLLTGDIEMEQEARLAADYSFLDVDVLKVGHHGSKTSSSERFLHELTPKLAVISVGDNNRYGHPDDEVISRLVEHGIKILRTDKHGAITYIFRGETGTFSTWIP